MPDFLTQIEHAIDDGMVLMASQRRNRELQDQQRQLEEEAAWLMLERKQLLADMGIQEGEGTDG